MTNDINSPDALIIAPAFIRVNDSAGKAVARANKMVDGTWTWRTQDGEWITGNEAQALGAMQAAAVLRALRG